MSSERTSAKTTRELEDFMITWVAKELNQSKNDIFLGTLWPDLGLSSRATVTMMEALGEFLECQIDPSLAADFPSIRSLAGELGSRACQTNRN